MAVVVMTWVRESAMGMEEKWLASDALVNQHEEWVISA